MLLGVSLSARSADLLEVYHLAQANDPTYQSAHYTLLAAEQKIPQARAGLLPVVSLNGNDNVNRISSQFGNTPEVKRDINAWTWTLQLTQPLIRAQNLYAYKESESIVDQARAEFSVAEQDLILRVAQAYFDVLVAQSSIDVADAQLHAAEEQMALAKRSFELGKTAITDVHEAKSRADLARSQRIAANNDLNSKRAELEKAVGDVPETLVPLLPEKIIPNPQPDDVKAWVAQARENNPAVKAPRAALAAAETEISRNRAEHLPTLDLVASYGQNYSSGTPNLPNDFSTQATSSQAGLQLTVPIYAGGATSSKVVEAIANRDKAAAQLEEAKRKAATDAKQAYAAIVNGLAQIQALESAVDSSKSAVHGNQVGYKLGIHINIDVLNAEQQLYTAQRDLIKARYDTLFQGLKLKAAAGELNEADVMAVNGFLTH